MGYRPNIVENYEITYGDQIAGFNHSFDEFTGVLDELGLEYSILHEYETLDIDSEGIEKLKNIDIKAFLENSKDMLKTIFSGGSYSDYDWGDIEKIVKNLVNLLIRGLDTPYCKKTGSVKIDWF